MNRKFKITYITKSGNDGVIMIFTSNKLRAIKWFKEVHPKDKLISIERVRY